MSSSVNSGQTMAVVGGGTMGVGIAYVFAAAGWSVNVVEPVDARRDTVRRELAQAAADGLRRGKLDATQAAQVSEGVDLCGSLDAIPDGLTLVVETVPEQASLKHRVLAAIAARAPSLIATNTSALSIDALAGSVNDPGRFLGMHFFNPVWSLPLVEVVRGTATSDAALNAARRHVESLGKTCITVRDSPGFATSRLDLIVALEAIRMVEDGVASAEDIDRAMQLAYRHPVGPLRLTDIVGLDVRLDIARHLSATLGPRYAPPALLQAMVERGELGRKSGRGFFDWTSP